MTDFEEIDNRYKALQQLDAEFKRRVVEDRLRQMELQVQLFMQMQASISFSPAANRAFIPYVLTC